MKILDRIKLDRFFFLGLFVLFSVFANQYVNFVRWQDPLEILWFCDMTAVFLGAGLIFRSKKIVTLTLVMAIPAQFLWIVDFFLELFGDGMGRTAQLWSYGDVVFWFSVNLHAVLIPISFYAVWNLGFDKKVLGYVLVYVLLLLVVTYLMTEPVENRNCVFYGCDSTDPGSGYLRYFVFDFLIPWQLIFIASFIVQKKIFSLLKKDKKI
ncbi:MAG: hypothetical protein U9O20_01380 [Patescibacteria group bacterium]|nr:hypothetical protein [Patescibacteria group bacterium]